MGATFVSPFIGWKEGNGEEMSHFVRRWSHLPQLRLQDGDYRGCCANGRQIVEAAVAGAYIVTAGFDVYKDAFDRRSKIGSSRSRFTFTA